MKRRAASPAPRGVFRPRRPTDADDVLRLFAVAARVVCEAPESLPQVNQALLETSMGLLPPESLAAAECERLWRAFERALGALPRARWPVAGQALLGDLEAAAQRLDALPLPPWERLPAGLDEGGGAAAPRLEAGEGARVVLALGDDTDVEGPPALVAGARTLRTIVALDPGRRGELLRAAVAAGAMSRADVTMLARFLVKGDELTLEHEALLELLGRLQPRLPPS